MGRTLAIAEHPATELPTRYTWSFPGSPVKVQVELDVVERLQVELRAPVAGAPKQGYLMGKVAGQTTEVHGFKALDAEPPAKPPVTTDVQTADPLQVVGYYKNTKDALRLAESDIALAEAAFPKPHQVFLLIQTPESGPANAAFFFWDDGRMDGDFPFLEFPFDVPMLARAEQQRIQTAQMKLILKPEVFQATNSEDTRNDRRNGLKWAILAGLGAMLILACLAAFIVMRMFPERIVAEKPAVEKPAPAAPVEPAPQAPLLGLQAERQNGDLKVSWNRDSPAIRTATSGVLAILAGGGKREIELDAAEVRNGSILYAPTTDQIQIRLTITGPQNTIAESVVVLLPKTGAPKVQQIPQKRVPAVEEAPTPNSSSAVISTLPLAPIGRAVSDPPPAVTQHPKTQTASAPPQRPQTDLRAAAGTAAPAANTTLPETVPAAVPQQPLNSTPAASLSAPGAIYHPPEIEKAAALSFPTALGPLIINTKLVEVKVGIDEFGKVTKAEALPTKGWVHQLMTSTAVRAARLYKFKPARRGEQPTPSEMILQFRFQPPR